MWNDFTDFDLATLAGQYRLQDCLRLNDKLQLSNREEVECMITEYEYNLAFGDPVDFNSEVEYT